MTLKEIANIIIEENSPIDYGWLRYCDRHCTDWGLSRTPSVNDIMYETALGYLGSYCKTPQIVGKVAKIMRYELGI